jgi:hypothetical protein
VSDVNLQDCPASIDVSSDPTLIQQVISGLLIVSVIFAIVTAIEPGTAELPVAEQQPYYDGYCYPF